MKTKFLFIFLSLSSCLAPQTILPMEQIEQVKNTLPKSENWLMPDGVLSNEQINYIIEKLEKVTKNTIDEVKQIVSDSRAGTRQTIDETLDKLTQQCSSELEKTIATISNNSNNSIQKIIETFDKKLKIQVEEVIQKTGLAESNESIQNFLNSWDSKIVAERFDLKPITDSFDNVGKQVEKSVEKIDASAAKITTSLDRTNITLDNSLINKDHADIAQKSFFISAFGLLISGYGAKLLYDGICEISTKLDHEENQDQWFWERLAMRDYLKPTLGLIAITAGFTSIVKSKQIAQKFL